MGTLLFMHGIGGRGDGHDKGHALVRHQVARHLPGLPLEACDTSGTLGTPRPQALRAIPGHAAQGAGAAAEARDVEALRWRLLYLDPLVEMRALAALGGDPDPHHMPVSPLARSAQKKSTESHLARLRLLRFGDELLHDAGLGAAEAQALQAQVLQQLAAEPQIDSVLMAPQIEGDIDRRHYLARAFVAAWIVAAEHAGLPAVGGALRDRLCAQAVLALGGAPHKALRDRIGEALKGVAASGGSHWTARNRGMLADDTPLPAELLRYQLRGQALRDLLRRRVAEVQAQRPGPVVLMAHGVEAIAGFELLNEAAPPTLAGLVTVGSPATCLYELDALSTLRQGAPLPAAFPPWLNVHDPADLLSGVAEALFGGRVHDLAVESRQPFPQSHGAYWSQPALWAALKGFVQ